jgi:YVTN family beta-propeller protein
MKLYIFRLLMIAAFAFAGVLGSAQSLAQSAYIPAHDIVSVINTVTNAVVATVPIPGQLGRGVAVSPDGSKVYVTTVPANAVTVIDTKTNSMLANIPVEIGPFGVAMSPDGTSVWVTSVTIGGPSAVTEINAANNTILGVLGIVGEPRGVAVAPNGETYVAIQDVNAVVAINPALGIDASYVVASPTGIAVSPDGTKVYVTNEGGSNTVSVIDTTANAVTATIPVGDTPAGVAVSPDGSKVYVANQGFSTPGNTVSVIDTTTNTVTATISVGNLPIGVSVTPDGSKILVANNGSNNVSVIDAVRNVVTATISVGGAPFAFGSFIGPAPQFAGVPGNPNCHGQSVAALARQYGGLNGAAAVLGYSDVSALQRAIMAFCEG